MVRTFQSFKDDEQQEQHLSWPSLVPTWRGRPVNLAARHCHRARFPVLPDANVLEEGVLITSEVCLRNARGVC